jgi:hypothetical protein
MPGDRACNRISVAVAAVLAAGIVAGILVPAGSGWDFANFYDAGHKVLAGQLQDLYYPLARIEGKPPQGQLAFYGVPLSALLFAAMAWMPPGAAMIAFKAQATGAILLGLWLLYSRNVVRSGLSRAQYRAAFLVAALLFQPFWTIYRVGGQTTPTLFLGFVLALIWLTSGRLLAAAVCLVAVVAIKPAFVLTLGLLGVMAGIRFLAYVAATGAAAAGISILTMGWSIHQRFLEHLSAGKISSWMYNSSISVALQDLPALAALTRVLAAGLVLSVLLRARKRIAGEAAGRHFLFLTAIAFGLLLMPVVWEHYLSVLFIPVAYFLAAWPRWKWTGVFCLACSTQNLVFILWLQAVLPTGNLPVQAAAAIFKSAPLILFTVLLWRYWKELAATYDRAAEPAPRRTVGAYV